MLPVGHGVHASSAKAFLKVPTAHGVQPASVVVVVVEEENGALGRERAPATRAGLGSKPGVQAQRLSPVSWEDVTEW